MSSFLGRRLDSRSTKNYLFFLHGLFGNKLNWNYVMKLVEGKLDTSKWKVVALDLLNHGSNIPSEDVGLLTLDVLSADVANSIKNAMEDEPGASVSILGHSLGGKVAMHMCLNDMIKPMKKLIVVDVSPRPHTELIAKPFKSKFYDYISSMKYVESLRLNDRKEIEKIFREKSQEPSPAICQFLLTNLVHAKDSKGDSKLEYFKFRNNLTLLESSLSHLFDFPMARAEKTFECPSLFIRGDKSDYIDEAIDWPLIERLFPRSELLTLPGGHWLHTENPQAFADVIHAFLSKKFKKRSMSCGLSNNPSSIVNDTTLSG